MMKNRLCRKTSVLVGVALGGLAAFPAQAQDNPTDTLNRFRLSYRPGFNIAASFRELTTVSSAVSGIDHEYVDGYNRVDSTGNAQHYTRYWSIQNASQYPGDGYLYLHNMDAGSVKDITDDPQHGGEVSYNRQLGTFGNFFWGIEAAANYTAIDISDSFSGNVSLITDKYLFPYTYPSGAGGQSGNMTGGQVSPLSIPYNGTYSKPYGSDTPLLNDIPQRSITQASATAQRNLSADLYGFRLGPYIELPLSARFTASLSGGFALGYIDSKFSFIESLASPKILRRGSSSDDDVLLGGFVGANISYNFSRAWSAFAGAQYQNLGTFSQTANNKEAKLDLSTSIFVNIGLGVSF